MDANPNRTRFGLLAFALALLLGVHGFGDGYRFISHYFFFSLLPDLTELPRLTEEGYILIPIGVAAAVNFGAWLYARYLKVATFTTSLRMVLSTYAGLVIAWVSTNEIPRHLLDLSKVERYTSRGMDYNRATDLADYWLNMSGSVAGSSVVLGSFLALVLIYSALRSAYFMRTVGDMASGDSSFAAQPS